MKVAKIPYLNAVPFYAGWGDDPPFESVSMVPRELGVAARNGTIDAGLMAVADWFRVDGLFDLIEPALGVAASEHVKSVILFSHDPPRRLDGRRVVVTRESSTPRRLAQLLAVAYGRARSRDSEDEPKATRSMRRTGLLLIGDARSRIPRLTSAAGPGRSTGCGMVDVAGAAVRGRYLDGASALPRRERERFGGYLSGSWRSRERLASREENAGPLATPNPSKPISAHHYGWTR